MRNIFYRPLDRNETTGVRQIFTSWDATEKGESYLPVGEQTDIKLGRTSVQLITKLMGQTKVTLCYAFYKHSFSLKCPVMVIMVQIRSLVCFILVILRENTDVSTNKKYNYASKI